MPIKRRDFLIFLGASMGTAALGCRPRSGQELSSPFSRAKTNARGLNFEPVQLPMPLETDAIAPDRQIAAYQTYEVIDDLVLPEGYTYQVIAAWGDRLGDSRVGYNNDYLSFVETAPNEGYLTINFEYISGQTWMQTFETVIGRSLPFAQLIAATSQNGGTIDAFTLAESDPLKAQITEVAKEALTDLGMGVMSLRRLEDGTWERTNSQSDRRITGISGLEDGRYLKTTGPAVSIFEKANKQGYDDQLGDRAIGTFQNCAGGTTPWGTVFSAEENFQDQVIEPVLADGSSFNPSQYPFAITDRGIARCGNVFGLAGNKYGWMVEVDPSNPDDYGTKHTWLGRYRHEAVGIFAESGKKLAFYSGCDRRGGHLYKFVSNGTVSDITDKANSRLLEDGMLYGAKFNADGTGQWVPLTTSTPIDPVLPSQVEGNLVVLPNGDRQLGGVVPFDTDQQVLTYKQQFSTLGDLYTGNDLEKQGAILIDAHFAASAAGITCTGRPEDTEVGPDGTLYIAFTSGTPSDSDGGPHKAIFKGPKGEEAYEFGWIFKLQEDDSDPAAMTFRWESFAAGGEPADGGMGFSNPDNVAVDKEGNLWMVTDMSTSSHNEAVPSRVKDGQVLNTKDKLGLFGNNSVWYLPTSGSNAGNAYPFAIGPMETECTGPYFTNDGETLFLAIQHPGERNGIRTDGAVEIREFAMQTPDGQEFMQERTVPIGSNWPGKGAGDVPKPAVVAIRLKSA
ncbi:MAG: DUF839 domain-containing protein [Cyanobacteriota bacterium]|nr:DUF839 domain-containing protein [Cyanobacteriota bacterium]